MARKRSSKTKQRLRVLLQRILIKLQWPLFVLAILLFLITVAYPFIFPQSPSKLTYLPQSLQGRYATLSFARSTPYLLGEEVRNQLLIEAQRPITGRGPKFTIEVNNLSTLFYITDIDGHPKPSKFLITVDTGQNIAETLFLHANSRKDPFNLEPSLLISVNGSNGKESIIIDFPMETELDWYKRQISTKFDQMNSLLLSIILFAAGLYVNRLNEKAKRQVQIIENIYNEMALQINEDPAKVTKSLMDLLNPGREDRECIRENPDLRDRVQKIVTDLRKRSNSGAVIEQSCMATLSHDMPQAVQILLSVLSLFDPDGWTVEFVPLSEADKECAKTIKFFVDIFENHPNKPTASMIMAIQHAWDEWDYFAKEIIVAGLPAMIIDQPALVLHAFENNENLRRLLLDERVLNMHRDFIRLKLNVARLDIRWPSLKRMAFLERGDMRRWLAQLNLQSDSQTTLFSAANFPRERINELGDMTPQIFSGASFSDHQLAAELAVKHLREAANHSAFPILVAVSDTNLQALLRHREMLADWVVNCLYENWIQLLVRQPFAYLDLLQDDQRLLAHLFAWSAGSHASWEQQIRAMVWDQAQKEAETRDSVLPNDTRLHLVIDRVKRYCNEVGSQVRTAWAHERQEWFTVRPAGLSSTCLIFVLDEGIQSIDAKEFIQLVRGRDLVFRNLRISSLIFLPVSANSKDQFSLPLCWSEQELIATLDGWVNMIQAGQSQPDSRRLPDYRDIDALFADEDIIFIELLAQTTPKTLLARNAAGSLWRLIEITERAIYSHVTASADDDGRLTTGDLRNAGIVGLEEDVG